MRLEPTAPSYGLTAATIAQLQHVLAAFPQVDTAWLYGSRALGTFKRGSDIDLCLEGAALTFGHLLAVDTALDDLLLPYKIDLSLLAHIDNAALRLHIASVGQPLYRRPGACPPG